MLRTTYFLLQLAAGASAPDTQSYDGAGRPIPFLKKKSERPIAVVDEIFCSGCDFCTDICPFDCLEIVKDHTRPLSNSVVKMVNEENCVACRLCEDVCQKELLAACKGLAIGKYCGMRHQH